MGKKPFKEAERIQTGNRYQQFGFKYRWNIYPYGNPKGVDIQLQNMDKELSGFVDIDMIKTVIRNLISNAIKFSFEGGTISIASR